MNDVLTANAVWTWTWTGGPLAGTVQPLIGNQIELYPDRDSRLPLIKLWHTPVGFVVQIAGKKVMRDGVRADVLLLQPGDCLRTKEFEAVIDWSPIEANPACFATPWSPETDCVADGLTGENSSAAEVATSDELDKAYTELEQPLPDRSTEGNEDSEALGENRTLAREQQSTGANHLQDALQALESIKQQLLAAPLGMSSAVFESLDDIARRLDLTAELIKELAMTTEKATSDSAAPTAQAEKNDAPDQLKKILKRLEVESVDISDLVELKANKSISDADLLQINPIYLVSTPPAASEDRDETLTEASSQPTPKLDAIDDSKDVRAEQLETLNNEPSNEIPVVADPEPPESIPELQQFRESETDTVEAFPESSRGSETENLPFAEDETETTDAATSDELDFERQRPEMHSAMDSPADAMNSLAKDSRVDIVDYSHVDYSHEAVGQIMDYPGDTAMPVEDFAYGLNDTSYPKDLVAPTEPATEHYPGDFSSSYSHHMMHTPHHEEVIESRSNVTVEVALANLNIINEDGSATAEESFNEEHLAFQRQASVDEAPPSTEPIVGLSTAAYLSSILQEESQKEQPLPEETPVVDESPVVNDATCEYDSDDGINAYMNQLFSRLRGDKAPAQTPASQAKKKEVVEPTFAETPTKNVQPLVPLKEEEFVPQKTAPELQKDMNAMRRLANESTRAALSTFNEQRKKAMANARIGMMFGLFGFSVTMLLVSRSLGDIFNLIGISALIAAAGTSVWHYLELKKFKQLEQQADLAAPQANSENL